MRKQITQIFIFQVKSNAYFDTVVKKVLNLGGSVVNFRREGVKCTMIVSSEMYYYEKLRSYIGVLNGAEILL